MTDKKTIIERKERKPLTFKQEVKHSIRSFFDREGAILDVIIYIALMYPSYLFSRYALADYGIIMIILGTFFTGFIFMGVIANFRYHPRRNYRVISISRKGRMKVRNTKR